MGICGGKEDAAAAAASGLPNLTKADANGKITKQGWRSPMEQVLDVAICGYPGYTRPAKAEACDLLREHRGNADAAVLSIKSSDSFYVAEITALLQPHVPFKLVVPDTDIFPKSLAIATYVELRHISIIAAIYGHDLQDDKVRGRIIMAAAGATTWDFLNMEQVIPWALDQLWNAALAAAMAAADAEMPPPRPGDEDKATVGTVIAGFLGVKKDKAIDIAINNFKKDAPGVPPCDWEKPQEPRSDKVRISKVSKNRTLAAVSKVCQPCEPRK
eukprot:TRINITY_DN47988_c0_g1_i1.p1 TRINITY_DN47988_c0_g1~~TRINITY_DN47988_c0_g1_i1.p1  ORF type:complete len:293 (-),score=60.29 TRINITY_DN47988_c0_g1_i1:172-987(-)